MLQQRWNNATARERLLIIVMTIVVFFAVLMALLVRPAWRVVQAAPATLDALDAKVLTMRAQAAQLRAAPATRPAAAAAPLSAERELSSPGATVTETRDSTAQGSAAITVNLKRVDGVRLGAWLAKPQTQEQLQRLSVTRDPATGQVTGSIVLRAPA